MAFVLTTDTNPGVAQWVACSAVTAPYTGLMFGDNHYTGGSSNGSIAAPFITIQAALDAIGSPTPGDVVDAGTGWTVLITTGYYDEDLVLPDLRALCLEGIGPSSGPSISGSGAGPGTVFLYDGAIADPRTITLNVTTPNTFGSLFTDAAVPIQIKNFELIDGMSFSEDGALAGPTASDVKLYLENVSFLDAGGATINDSIRATGWDAGTLYLSFNNANLIGFGGGGGPGLAISGLGGGIVLVVDARTAFFGGDIEVDRYVSFSDCEFAGDITLTAGVSPGQRVGGTGGFINCGFRGIQVLTSGVAGSGLVDATSFESFVASGWTVAGAATIVSSADAYFDATDLAVWVAGGNDTTSQAISRIANALTGLLGPGPIPL